MNRSGLDYFGLTLDEWRDKPCAVCHPDDAERVHDQWGRAMSNGSAFESEERMRKSDGSYRWFLARFGGSLALHGLTETRPHFTARPKADETTPATLRTVFALIGRGCFFRVRPPEAINRFHSRFRWSGVICFNGSSRSSRDRYATHSR